MCYGFWLNAKVCKASKKTFLEFVAIGSRAATQEYMDYHKIGGDIVKAKPGSFKYL